MTPVATRRLIDASATLNAADRALLNIWINRGLDDAAVARMTGMSEATIADRRARMVTQLSATLGLPPENVRSALGELTAAPASGVAGGVEAPFSAGNGSATHDAATEPDLAGSPAAPGPAARGRSRRRRWAGLALVAIAAVVVLVVSLTASGPGARRDRRAAAPAAVAPSGQGASTTVAPPGTLVALPGGSGHAAGTVTAAGQGRTLRLDLSVSRLPAARRGHYEVWLYDSITDSRAIGPLRAGASHESLPLPSGAARYRWIDVSFQPAGAVFHSGESVLRAANPASNPAGR